MFGDNTDIQQFKKSYTKLTSAQFGLKYNLQDSELLGRGSYGAVYKVKTSQGQEIAIKQFTKQANRHAKQIVREVDNLKILSHPNIARFYDFYVVDDRKYYIVMEYCSGGNLLEFLQKNVLTQEDKVKLCKNIADGLTHAHNKKIVHRDLKPENILIGRHNMAKICDFGCSVLSQNPQGSSSILSSKIGTPAYMDYRMQNGQPYDMSVDVYALGMIFVSIFKGSGIYDNCRTIVELQRMKKDISQDFQQSMQYYLADIPKFLKQIIKNCLQRDYKKRFKAFEISEILEKQIQRNTSKISKLLSTVDQQEIQDQSSIFAIGLIKYYKNIDKIQQNLSTRQKLFEILCSSKENMDKIITMERLKYVQIDTKEQFTTFVLFYYYFWLDRLTQLLNGCGSVLSKRYPEIVPQLIQQDVMIKAKGHIKSQKDKYLNFFNKCCNQQKRKLNLMDPKQYRPKEYKQIIRKMALHTLKEFDFSDYEDKYLRQQINIFLSKRVESEFRIKSKKDDPESISDLQIIKEMVSLL